MKKIRLSIGLLLMILSVCLPMSILTSEFVALTKLFIFVIGLFLIVSCIDVPSENEKHSCSHWSHDQDGNFYHNNYL